MANRELEGPLLGNEKPARTWCDFFCKCFENSGKRERQETAGLYHQGQKDLLLNTQALEQPGQALADNSNPDPKASPVAIRTPKKRTSQSHTRPLDPPPPTPPKPGEHERKTAAPNIDIF